MFNIKLLSKPKFLIELTENQLILAHIKKKHLSDSIYIINVSNVNIDQTSFRNGVIYKPSLIRSHISQFLNIQKLKSPKTFISIPDLAKKHDLMLTLATFQAALCMSNEKVKISSITDSPFFDAQKNLLPIKVKPQNLLNLLGNNKIRSPFPWILSSAICLVSLIVGLKDMTIKNNVQISSLKSCNSMLQNNTANLTMHLKNFSQIKTSNIQIKSSLLDLESSYAHTQNPFNHIMAIASKTPATGYLTNINFYKKTETPKNSIPKATIKKQHSHQNCLQNYHYVELEGYVKNIKSANRFIRLLAENTNLFKKIDILYVKKIKHLNKNKTGKKTSKKTSPQFQFKAVGELKYIC
jgi:hypothetical protein